MKKELKLVKDGERIKGRDYPDTFSFEIGCDCMKDEQDAINRTDAEFELEAEWAIQTKET